MGLPLLLCIIAAAFPVRATAVDYNVTVAGAEPGVLSTLLATNAALANLSSQTTASQAANAALGVQLLQTNIVLGNLSSLLAVTNAAVHNLSSQTTASLAATYAAVDNLSSKTTASLAATNAAVGNLSVSMSELLASRFTLSSAGIVKNCARSSVFFIKHDFANCSAFSYHSGLEGAQGDLLVSAAHCFIDSAGLTFNFSGKNITA